MADRKVWPALTLRADRVLTPLEEDALAALLDDFSPIAVQDLAELPLPPGGLWDSTYPPPPDPPPAPLHWRVFFADVPDRRAANAAVQSASPSFTITEEDVSDEDWAARSQQALAAVRAGRFVVAPPWDLPGDSDATVIIIEPSRGFGTGHHASTRLCLRALSEMNVKGWRVLDLGTGSGVLAMAAALAGARAVVAIDVDPEAVESARESAARNRLPVPVTFVTADFRDPAAAQSAGMPAGTYDLVLANLTGGMLASAATCIQSLIAPGGTLVMSGFETSECKPVLDAFAPLVLHATIAEDGWVSLTVRRA